MNQGGWRKRSFYDWLLIGLLALLLLTAGGRLAPQDEETTYRVTANLIEYGRWTIAVQTFTFELQPLALTATSKPAQPLPTATYGFLVTLQPGKVGFK